MIWLISLIAIYAAAAAMLYLRQRRFMYFPDRPGASLQPPDIAGAETLMIRTLDGESLEAWFAPGRAGRPVILFFQGNAGHISHRAARFVHLAGQGFGALFVSYRGFGSSSGQPSEAGLIMDALAAYDWLRARGFAADKIAVMGESLGAAVGVQLAARRQVLALALEAPFTSAVHVARRYYWWLPVGLLLKDRFDSLAAIRSVSAPLMVAHGSQDEIIPVAQGKQLFAAAIQPKQLLIIDEGSHNGFSDEEVWDNETAFIMQAAGGGG